MSGGTLQIDELESTVEAETQTHHEAPSSGGGGSVDLEAARHLMERLARDRQRNRAWGFDD